MTAKRVFLVTDIEGEPMHGQVHPGDVISGTYPKNKGYLHLIDINKGTESAIHIMYLAEHDDWQKDPIVQAMVKAAAEKFKGSLKEKN